MTARDRRTFQLEVGAKVIVALEAENNPTIRIRYTAIYGRTLEATGRTA